MNNFDASIKLYVNASSASSSRNVPSYAHPLKSLLAKIASGLETCEKFCPGNISTVVGPCNFAPVVPASNFNSFACISVQ
ncbi:MAG: hypothetical protein MJ201_03635 [Mycoplasmoidaceae bacterium]|nr:hypothetical protein [Mycoplasmoidaceae bacterium]